MPDIFLTIDGDDSAEGPDGVTYTASYVTLSSGGGFSPHGQHLCMFCSDPDWRWVLRFAQPPPPSDWSMNPTQAACAGCHADLLAGDSAAILARAAHNPNQDYVREIIEDATSLLTAAEPREE